MPAMGEIEICVRLGIMPPVAYIKATGRGNSWRMLLDLVRAVSSGEKVCISAHDHGYGVELTRIAKDWADRLGLNAGLIKRPVLFEDVIKKLDGGWNFNAIDRYFGAGVYIDHHAWVDYSDRRIQRHRREMAQKYGPILSKGPHKWVVE